MQRNDELTDFPLVLVALLAILQLVLVALLAILIAFAAGTKQAHSHDIYTGVHGKDNQLCCGGDPVTGDCRETTYRMSKGHYLFMKRDGTEVDVPESMITFLPVPGEDTSKTNGAHLCYRQKMDTDVLSQRSDHIIGDIFLYCAFINPGSI